MKKIVLGNEAVALGAIHSGISAAFAYPGTPSTEITEFLIEHQEEFGFHAEWCSNEKTAYEAALGVSFSGKRALVSMKHVGLNVAMDAFVNSAISGVKGGLVIAIADDPGMHSSQNEQDSRYLADFAKIMILEPANSQEAYDLARKAFDLSEKHGIPVMVRVLTRLSHVREPIELRDQRKQNFLDTEMRRKEWVLLPENARNQFKKLLEKQPALIKESEENELNEMQPGTGTGVISAGNAFNYFMEVSDGNTPFLRIASYPLPEKTIRNFSSGLEKILVLEEGYPFIEEKLHSVLWGQNIEIIGKLTGNVQLTGELNAEIVKEALGLEVKKFVEVKTELSIRPPQPCAGCPHSDLFNALNESVNGTDTMVFGDVGCYTLGALPPFNAINTCICMGSSVNLSRGATIAGAKRAVGVIGDSTFMHSGISGLVEAAKNNNPITLLVLDNSTVAMTGGQETMLGGEPLVKLIEGIGVPKEHIRIILPLPANHEENVKVLKEEIGHNGVSVVVSRRECIQTLKRRLK